MKVKSLIRLKSAVFYILIVLFLSKFTEVPEPYYPVVTEFCDTENTSFQIGEKIEYDLYYNWGLIWIPAGCSLVGCSFPQTDLCLHFAQHVHVTVLTHCQRRTLGPHRWPASPANDLQSHNPNTL